MYIISRGVHLHLRPQRISTQVFNKGELPIKINQTHDKTSHHQWRVQKQQMVKSDLKSSDCHFQSHLKRACARNKTQLCALPVQLRLTLFNPMNRSTPGFPVHHQLLELAQTHVHWVSDAIQPSHPLSSPFLPTFRLPCPSPMTEAYSNSCPSSQWCHPTISSPVVPFSSHLQSFPASGSFQMSQLFASGGQSIGVSASALVLPMNIQDWLPLGWTGLISFSPGDSQEASPTPPFKSINSSVLSFLFGPTLTSIHDYWKNHSFD